MNDNLALGLILALPLALISPRTAGAKAPDDDASPHSWKYAFRGAAWISKLTGEVDFVDVSDLDLSDFEPGADAEAELRFGKHNLTAAFTYYRNDGSDSDVVLGVPITVETDFQLYTLGIAYDYSFWTIEENGFRLGPGIGIAGMFPDFEFREATTGLQTSYDQPFPSPLIRLTTEIPIYRDFLLDAEGGAFYLPPVGNADLEGFISLVVTRAMWRPLDHLGCFVGFRWLHVGAEDDRTIDLSLDLWGPEVGVELRF